MFTPNLKSRKATKLRYKKLQSVFCQLNPEPADALRKSRAFNTLENKISTLNLTVSDCGCLGSISGLWFLGSDPSCPGPGSLVSGCPVSGCPVSGCPVSSCLGSISGLWFLGSDLSCPGSGCPVSGCPVSGCLVSGCPVSGCLGSSCPGSDLCCSCFLGCPVPSLPVCTARLSSSNQQLFRSFLGRPASS